MPAGSLVADGARSTVAMKNSHSLRSFATHFVRLAIARVESIYSDGGITPKIATTSYRRCSHFDSDATEGVRKTTPFPLSSARPTVAMKNSHSLRSFATHCVWLAFAREILFPLDGGIVPKIATISYRRCSHFVTCSFR